MCSRVREGDVIKGMAVEISLDTGTKQKMMDQIRADIRDFKSKKNLDKVSSCANVISRSMSMNI